VLVPGCGEMLCRGVGEELMGGETLRGGVSGVPIVGQCSPGLESSPMALRIGLQPLIVCGSGGQQIATLLPHIAPACTLYALPTATAADEELPGLTGYDVVAGRVAGIGLEE
jgi:hypothetical protein